MHSPLSLSGLAVNKLPLANLPISHAPSGSYERQLNIKLNEIMGMQRQVINKLIQNPDLPEYADNTAALAGGLVSGQFYRTAAGAVMVVL